MILALFALLLFIAMVGVKYTIIITSCDEMREEIERARKFYHGRAIAQVTEVEKEQLGKSDIYYWPVFRYKVDGVEYEKKTSLFTDQHWWYQKGWEYEIRYNENNPEEFMILDDSGSYDRAQTIVKERVAMAVIAVGLAALLFLTESGGIEL